MEAQRDMRTKKRTLDEMRACQLVHQQAMNKLPKQSPADQVEVEFVKIKLAQAREHAKFLSTQLDKAWNVAKYYKNLYKDAKAQLALQEDTQSCSSAAVHSADEDNTRCVHSLPRRDLNAMGRHYGQVHGALEEEEIREEEEEENEEQEDYEEDSDEIDGEMERGLEARVQTGELERRQVLPQDLNHYTRVQQQMEVLIARKCIKEEALRNQCAICLRIPQSRTMMGCAECKTIQCCSAECQALHWKTEHIGIRQ